jgi:PEP-CTERM motif-containing protein
MKRIFLTAVILLSLGSLVHASSFSFTGTFVHDTDLQAFTFTLLNPTAGVTLRTWSYAGGTNAAGQVIGSGGFEPYLNLYFSDGTQMNPGFAGPCVAPQSPDPVTGVCGDVYYPTEKSFPGGVWDAGTYIVVLSSFANPGIGNLSDGFFASQVLGLPVPSNFTCQVGSPGYQGNPPVVGVDQPFCDEFLAGTQRTGNWELDIVGVDRADCTDCTPTNVPEPTSMLMLGTGLAGFAGVTRRKLNR